MQYKSDFKVYQWNEKQIKKLAYLQKELLISGLQCLKIGGELVYSTCTTNTIENEGAITSVLEELGGSVELINVEIEEKSHGIITNYCTPCQGGRPNGRGGCARFRPHIHHTGGFFIAKFRKINRIQNFRISPG